MSRNYSLGYLRVRPWEPLLPSWFGIPIIIPLIMIPSRSYTDPVMQTGLGTPNMASEIIGEGDGAPAEKP
jgi:hypothetical protein